MSKNTKSTANEAIEMDQTAEMELDRLQKQVWKRLIVFHDRS